MLFIRCSTQGHPGVAGSQRHRHHQQHLHPPQLQLQGELRPGHPGHSSEPGLRLVRLPMRKMTSGTSENPPSQAWQGFRDFGFLGDNQAEVRLATADATEKTSDFHRKTAKPQINQGLGGGAGNRSRTGTPSLAADFESATSTNSIIPANWTCFWKNVGNRRSFWRSGGQNPKFRFQKTQEKSRVFGCSVSTGA